jgi:UPF0271 protein
VTVIGPAGGELVGAAREEEMPYAREGFADRATRADGSLVPRGEPGALLLDPGEVVSRTHALALADDVETVCLHGDTPGVVTLARAVRETLDRLGGRRARRA